MMRRLLLAALVLGLAGAGRASVVVHLTPAELEANADAVVEGTVVDVAVAWAPDGRGLESTATVTVERVLAGAAPAVVQVVQPGGRLGEARHVIVGMPELVAGEAVRLHLRVRPDGRGYRVYGWAQGKLTLGAGEHPPALDYTYNGMVWPADMIPVPYLVHRDGTPDLPFADALAAVQAAFATWQGVPCSTLTYTYAGETDLRMAVDGQNVVMWIDDPAEWVYGEEAAAATALWIPVPEERTADVAFNGVYFEWAIAPDPWFAPHLLDVEAVLLHELGHFNGLSHTERAVDTMFVSWRPWQSQRTLSEDDKLGLCSLYPRDGDECATSDDCPPEETCDPYEYGTLCTRPPDPIGAFCNYERVECEAFCLFTKLNLSAGYCSRNCAVDSDCPPTHHCEATGAGTVRACFEGPPHQDAGVADRILPVDLGSPDVLHGWPDGGACGTTDDCPAGQYCGGGYCTLDCHTDDDCGSGRCGTDGRCASSGGCQAGRDPAGAVPLALLAFAVLAAWRRRSTHR